MILAYGAVSIYAHTNLRNVIRQTEGMLLEIAEGMGERRHYRQAQQKLAQRYKTEYTEKRFLRPSPGDVFFGSLAVSELIDALHVGPRS